MSNSEAQNQATSGDSPRYFRLLEKGEIIKESDIFLSKDQITPAMTSWIGEEYGNYTKIFRPVQVDEWISYAERKPTKEDFEPTGLIQGANKRGEFWHYGNASDSQMWIDRHVTFWRRITPTQPAKPKSVQIHLQRNGRASEVRTLTPNPDGSVTLDCQDRIAADQIEEFIKTYEEVTKVVSV